MARKAIHAAGGIVVRGGARPRIAVVQRSKDERWVLPRGKLKRHENPRAGARREAVEETGHRVRVHEFLGAIGYTRAFIDHPFSEVFELDVPKLTRWAAAGVRFALTWDELSPLLGVDPQDMLAAIRAVGPEHFMLSSDAGIPLLPQTVESYRLLAATLRAYGTTEVEMRQLMTGSAKEILNLSN